MNDVTKIIWDESFKEELINLQNSTDANSFLNN